MSLVQVTPAAENLLRALAGPGPIRVKLHIARHRADGMDFGLVLLDGEPAKDVLLLDGPVRVYANDDHAPVFGNAIVDAVQTPEGHGLTITVPDERKWMSCGTSCTALGADDCGGEGPCGGKGCHPDAPPAPPG